MNIKKPDVESILKGLKDFQRNTVEYVFNRLYGSEPVDRFLIADEVGLGKTLIAKGLIVKAIDHLWNEAHALQVPNSRKIRAATKQPKPPSSFGCKSIPPSGDWTARIIAVGCHFCNPSPSWTRSVRHLVH